MATLDKPREKVYRVLIQAIRAVDGTWCFRGTIVTADQLGDAESVRELLEQGKIEEVTHAAE